MNESDRVGHGHSPIVTHVADCALIAREAGAVPIARDPAVTPAVGPTVATQPHTVGPIKPTGTVRAERRVVPALRTVAAISLRIPRRAR